MIRLLFAFVLALPVNAFAYGESGNLPVEVIRNAYASTNVTTGAWVQLDSALDETVNAIEVFDSCGSVLKLGYGASGSELELKFYILPGGNGRVPIQIPKGARLVIRAVDANCTAGQLVINFYK